MRSAEGKPWRLTWVSKYGGLVMKPRSSGTCTPLTFRSCTTLNARREAHKSLDEFGWTKLIIGHTSGGKGREALRMYKDMVEEGVIPTTFTFVAALKACTITTNLAAGEQIHEHICRSGADSNIFVATTLLDMYSKCGSMAHARHVFESMPSRNVVSWNIMIMGYAQKEAGDVALHLYLRMQLEGTTPNDRTFVAALQACSSLSAQLASKEADGEAMKLECLAKGKSIHSQILKGGYESDIFIASALVDMYAKCGRIGDAYQVFEKIAHPNVVSWTAIIMGYAQMERGESALNLYERMQHKGIAPNAYTYVAALKACTGLAAQEEGKKLDGNFLKVVSLKKGRAIHSQIISSGLQSNVCVATSLVGMYSKCGSMVDAHQVFESMQHRDLVVWCAMIMGYIEMEKWELALQVYGRLQYEGFTPDAHIFAAILIACSNMASLEIGRQIHFDIRQLQLEGETFVVAGLVGMYGKCGSMTDAQQLFDTSAVRDVVSWNALIAAYGSQGDSEKVFLLFDRMQLEGVQPVESTFVSLLNACSHAGFLHKGQKYFQAMCSQYRIPPATAHRNCMVDIFGRAGQLEEALKMIKEISFNPDMVTWRTILGACNKWNVVEFGKYAFECAVKLDGKQAAM